MFIKRQAIVIGPTPPGTGVIYDANDCTALKFTSPTNLVLFSKLILLIPTSIIIDSFFTQFSLTKLGMPTAAIIIYV